MSCVMNKNVFILLMSSQHVLCRTTSIDVGSSWSWNRPLTCSLSDIAQHQHLHRELIGTRHKCGLYAGLTAINCTIVKLADGENNKVTVVRGVGACEEHLTTCERPTPTCYSSQQPFDQSNCCSLLLSVVML